MNSIVDEFQRIQSVHHQLLNQLSESTNHQRVADEETPRIESQQMPGGFAFNNQPDNPPVANSPTFLSKLFITGTATILIIILIPLYLVYRFLVYVFFLIASILIKFQRIRYQALKSNDAVDIARRFIRNFDERIGNTSIPDQDTNRVDNNETDAITTPRPDFLECAYSHSMLMVKKDVRWLLCYIESSQNSECVDFTHDVLIHPKFLRFVKRRNILMWGGDVADTEAYFACNQFNITKLPFLGFMCMTVNQIPTSSGMQQSPPVFSLVSKIQGYKDLNSILKKLDKAYKKYNPGVIRIQNLSLESANMTIVDPMGTTGTTHVNRSRTQANIAESTLQWRQWRKSQLVPVSNDADEYTKIAIKTPDGSRQVIKINRSCSLEEIYATIECTILNDIEIDDNSIYERPVEFTHEYKFNIFTVFPREHIVADSNTLIVDTPAIFPSGNIVVIPVN